MKRLDIKEVESCLTSCGGCSYKNCLALNQYLNQGLNDKERVRQLWLEKPQEMMDFFNSQCSVWPLAVNYY